MSNLGLLFVILSDNARAPWAQSLLGILPETQPIVVTGTPLQAAQYIVQQQIAPTHILLDIGSRGHDVLDEIDQLAQQCNEGTRVLAIGDTNDIVLYRGLISRGVADYLPMPIAPEEVLRALTAPSAAAPAAPVAAPSAPTPVAAPAMASKKRVISFLSAASGDGASVAALNAAYAISQTNPSTVLVDMDYQFGMVAKNLNLQNQYGIGDLFDHPERGVDATLLKRMVANYGSLHVITAPANLRFMPVLDAQVIHDLVETLKQTYDTVILDLPHAWVPWMAEVMQQSTEIVVVAQLWLKSVSHSARLTRVFRDMGIPPERVQVAINRSGARFKEGIEPRDFGRVCGAPIRYKLSNDIKTVVNAEAEAKTVIEMGPSELANDILAMARGLLGMAAESSDAPSARGGLFSRLKG